MSRHDRMFRDTKGFLDDFFQAFGDSTKVSPTEYFGLFQPPVGFSDLLERCQPSASPKVLVLDGQSRAGKTWTAVGLVKELLDQNRADIVWSTGEDSDVIYYKGNTTVATAINWVVQSLKSSLDEMPSGTRVRLIILLDDFFGSARLRPLVSDPAEKQLVRDCLTSSGAQNPILKSLSSYPNVQAALIMTGRSSILSLAEIQLGLQLGDRAGHSVGRSGRAIFQHVSGKLIGSGTHEWLDECLERHSAFVHAHEEFNLPPVAAFSEKVILPEPYSNQIPEILFGGDLRAIIDEIKFLPSSAADLKSPLNGILLVYVAPALVLPLPSIDSCLTGEAIPGRVRSILSLQPEEHGDFALRVPNRYYLRAIQEVLLERDSLELLADSLIAHADGLKGCDKQMRVLSRGLIERGLESIDEALKQIDGDGQEHAAELTASLSRKVEELPGAKQESLLKWEAGLVSGQLDSQVITDVVNEVPRSPGLASAIGWGLYRFRRILPLTDNRESVPVRKICNAFEVRARQLGEHEDHEVLTVAYSNFIRWATQMESKPGKKSPIHQLAQVASSIDSRGPASAALKMVLEDALIWADSYQVEEGVQCVSVEDLPSASELWDSLEAEALPEGVIGTDQGFSIANHFFSLEWHNEWKERAGYRREVLSGWLQRNESSAFKLIRDKPWLLDDNLTYHWSHMIAQWSVWARDWCFSQDPNAHEYQKELIGCVNQKHNHGIHTILMQAIDSAFERDNLKNRLRNAFFLLAIRSSGPACDHLLTVHKHLSDSIHRASRAPDTLKSDVAQAIYELIRQGYLDRTEAGVPLQDGDDLKDQLPRDLGIQCVDFLKEHSSEEEWQAYLRELDSITCLDVLPRDEADLIPYGRAV